MPADDLAGEVAGGLADDLVRWAAAARADEAGQARARTRWLRQQAEEEATFAGLLVDLAEQRATVLVRTTAARRHRGAVTAVGTDFVLLAPDTGRRALLVPLDAITTVRLADGDAAPSAPSGNRGPALDLLLGEALERLAADRPRVTIVTAGDPDPVAGELEAIGADVLTVLGANRTFVALAAVTEIAVEA